MATSQTIAASGETVDGLENLVGLYLDRLASIELSMPGMKGLTSELHAAAVQAQGRTSLTLAAAQKLTSGAVRGASMIFVTGAGCLPDFPHGETDGPPGIMVLARTLSELVDSRAVFACEDHYAGVIEAAANAAGIPLVTLENLSSCPGSGCILDLPLGPPSPPGFAQHVLAAVRPQALVSVERLAPNRQGSIHALSGADVTYYHSPVAHELFNHARECGAITIGVGDGGNEIGAGVIEAVTRLQVPQGEVVASSIGADVYVHAGTSNWGAMAVAACARFLCKKHDACVSEKDLEEVIGACTRAGANDGRTGRPIMQIDGVPLSVELAMLTIMNSIVDCALQ